MAPKHVIFFDGKCPLCNRSVRFVYGADKRRLFSFAPLGGKTATRELIDVPRGETLVLLQNYGTDEEKQLIEGKGALRILWLLGGRYAALGWLSYLPSFLFDVLYRVVVRYRYRLFSTTTPIQAEPDRFLP